MRQGWAQSWHCYRLHSFCASGEELSQPYCLLSIQSVKAFKLHVPRVILEHRSHLAFAKRSLRGSHLTSAVVAALRVYAQPWYVIL